MAYHMSTSDKSLTERTVFLEDPKADVLCDSANPFSLSVRCRLSSANFAFFASISIRRLAAASMAQLSDSTIVDSADHYIDCELYNLRRYAAPS